MNDKQAPWWQRALKFALSGIRSAFGLFARPQGGEEAPEPPSVVEVEAERKIEVELYKQEDPEEETELIENSPKPEDVAIANPEAEEQIAETANETERQGPRDQGTEEPLVAEPEPAIADTPVEPKAVSDVAETPMEIVVEEVVEDRAAEEIDTVGPVGPSLESELGPETESPPACANEAVDEATLLAESANTGAAAPAFPEPHMNSSQSNREDEVEEKPQAVPEETAEAPAADSARKVEDSSLEAQDTAEATTLAGHKERSESETIAGIDEHSAATEDAPAAIASEDSEPPVSAIVPEIAAEAGVASSAPAEAAEPAQQAAAAEQPHAKHFIKLEGRDKEADSSPFSVIVSQVYDGPLDLLLDLIRKQDIDIYDIPIARITAQFLTYVNQLKATDVDVAGEFIYTASLLIHIKSKMLLPRAPAGPDEQAEDPRRELVERLLEHERFKNAAQMLQQKQMLEAATWTNPGIREFREDVEAEPEIAADTVDLVRVFREILERARNRPVLNLEEDSVTVGQMIQFLGRRLNMEDKPVALRRLLSHTKSERALIAMFLALLELVRLQAILLRQDRAFSEIFIKKSTEFDAVVTEGMASARDDWR